ncbi:MAG TPA: hypothetical protein VK177_08365 [Flavobacteriales bacterium]|nr:hypothetical protein [Flavobacteriales bacterium]
MECEGQGNIQEALALFTQAWNEARTPFEKLTAAHYVARHQPTVQEKLRWDVVALDLAQVVRSKGVKEAFPSLYLNVGKGYEDLGDLIKARMHYEKALSFLQHLPDDGYGDFIKNGIKNRLQNLSVKKNALVA